MQQLGMLMTGWQATTCLVGEHFTGDDSNPVFTVADGLTERHAADLPIDEVSVLLLSQVRSLGATRVVIDSLSGFEPALAPSVRADFPESLRRTADAQAPGRAGL